jgi:hypothetical protein
LAVIEALREFEPYVRGQHVQIITDHAALKWIFTQKQPPGHLARWIAYLQSYNFTIIHRSGIRIPHADAISRCIQGEITEDDIASSSHLTIQENTITNSAKPPNYAEIDDFIDDKLMINSIKTPVEQIYLQIIPFNTTRNEKHIDNTTPIPPLKTLCLQSLHTPIIQSQYNSALESINNSTPPLSTVHFTVQQSPIKQKPAFNSNDITTANPEPVDKTLQNIPVFLSQISINTVKIKNKV